MKKLEVNFENYFLVGHSLGGYLSTCYALKHPEDIRRVVLLSPVGLPERPDQQLRKSSSVTRRIGIWALRKLWDSNVSPQAIVR